MLELLMSLAIGVMFFKKNWKIEFDFFNYLFLGVIYYVRNEYIRNKLMTKDLSVDEISATMNEFLK